jgi:serine carboxypeptidase-like clade 2
MMAAWVGLAALVGLAAAAPADMLITDLPGAPAGLNFNQYSGYVEVDAALEKSLFFWFVESQGDPSTDPLLLWLNGGPGSSSIGYGFFLEHGPFRVQADGATLALNPWAWNRDASVIYLESPAGVGFSYSDTTEGLSTNDATTAQDAYAFLQGWFELFPEYKNRNAFYITGESYGGHYVPTLANVILDEQPDWFPSLKGLGIGNPGIDNDWYYNVNEYAFVTFMYEHALIPQDAYLGAVKACGWSQYLGQCDNETFYIEPTPVCKASTTKALSYVPQSIDPYDVYAPTCPLSKTGHAFVESSTPFLKHMAVKYGMDVSYDPCMEDYATAYLNTEAVQEAIHARPGTNWRPSGGIKYDNPGDMMAPYFTRFIAETDWRILIWSGDVDAAVPFEGTQKWIECLGQPVTTDWKNWYTNDEVYGRQIGGSYKVYEGISFLTIKGCGHTVQSYCPQLGYEYYHDWLINGLY